MSNIDPFFDEKKGSILWNKAVWGLAFLDLNGNIIKVNPALCEMLEYSEHELLNKNISQITHPDDLQDDQDMRDRLVSGGLDHYIMSKRYITKTNKLIWVKLTIVIVDSLDGRVSFLLSQVSTPEYLTLPEIDTKKKFIADSKILSFLKAEWKWLITAGLALLLFSYREYNSYRELHNKVTSIEKSISEIEQKFND